MFPFYIPTMKITRPTYFALAFFAYTCLALQDSGANDGDANLKNVQKAPVLDQRPEDVDAGSQNRRVDSQIRQNAGGQQDPQKQQPGPPGGQGTLSSSVNCAVEINKHCHNIPRGSDIAVLQCLQDAGDTDEVLSPQCQQVKFGHETGGVLIAKMHQLISLRNFGT